MLAMATCVRLLLTDWRGNSNKQVQEMTIAMASIGGISVLVAEPTAERASACGQARLQQRMHVRVFSDFLGRHFNPMPVMTALHSGGRSYIMWSAT